MNAYLTKGERKIDKWFSQHSIAIADLSHAPKSFENFNSQEEIIISENNND
jgi:molybdopterin-guanine dinucleotide biosynthesis protein A